MNVVGFELDGFVPDKMLLATLVKSEPNRSRLELNDLLKWYNSGRKDDSVVQ